MALPSSTPPLLLTKRLTAFLHANASAQLPTLLLTTAHGKLLAHASPNAVALLRTHATVAASLLAIHTSSSVALPTALPGAPTPGAASPTLGQDDDGDAPPVRRSVKPVTITVQLSGGTVIVRRLKCGLLFVCIGPSASEPLAEQHESNGAGGTDHTHGLMPGSPSEVESLVSAGGQTTSSLESAGAAAVVAMRRQASELARWLDDKLGTLKVPDESVGVE